MLASVLLSFHPAPKQHLLSPPPPAPDSPFFLQVYEISTGISAFQYGVLFLFLVGSHLVYPPALGISPQFPLADCLFLRTFSFFFVPRRPFAGYYSPPFPVPPTLSPPPSFLANNFWVIFLVALHLPK